MIHPSRGANIVGDSHYGVRWTAGTVDGNVDLELWDTAGNKIRNLAVDEENDGVWPGQLASGAGWGSVDTADRDVFVRVRSRIAPNLYGDSALFRILLD